MNRLRTWLACRKLQRMVDRNKRSFEIRDYVKRRQAALRGRIPYGDRAAGLRPQPSVFAEPHPLRGDT